MYVCMYVCMYTCICAYNTQALYQSEGITFTHVKYIDNQPVLDLIEKRPLGILPSIDEELRVPNGSVKGWLEKLFGRHQNTKEFSEVRSNADLFQIKHYAGEVTYHSQGFLEKNKARLVDDAYMLLSKSGFGFLAQMFPASALDLVAGKASGRYSIVLYYIVLYYIVLYCIVLYCIVLYCIILYYIVLHCIVL
jgi:myosin heavy subunit